MEERKPCAENHDSKYELFAAGELEIAAEFNAKDSDAAGSADFVVLLNRFVISVLEVKVLFRHSNSKLFSLIINLMTMLSRAF